MPHPNQSPTPSNGPGTCPRCHRPVLWCLTPARKPMAVERAIDPTGNQAVKISPDGQHWTRQLSAARPTAEHDEVLHQPHIAICPIPPRRPTPRQLSATKTRTGVRPVRWQR